MKLVWYEGDPNDGVALIVDKLDDYTADLIVFPKDGGAHLYLDAVPRRDEGGGHTWRPLGK